MAFKILAWARRSSVCAKEDPYLFTGAADSVRTDRLPFSEGWNRLCPEDFDERMWEAGFPQRSLHLCNLAGPYCGESAETPARVAFALAEWERERIARDFRERGASQHANDARTAAGAWVVPLDAEARAAICAHLGLCDGDVEAEILATEYPSAHKEAVAFAVAAACDGYEKQAQYVEEPA